MANWSLTQSANRDLIQIVDNVIEFTGYAMSGIRLQNEIFERLDLLSYFPESGKIRPERNTREIIFRGYRIVYEIIEEQVVVSAIIHSSRLYPQPTRHF